MSNEINTRQNTEHALCYLAAQRQLYNNAKSFAFYEFIFAICPLFISIFKSFDIISEHINLFSILITIISILATDQVKKKRLNLQSTAATIQQLFDTFVYNMEWDTKLFGKKINLNDIIAKKSKKILSNPKEKEKLLNWYTNIDVNLPLNEGILMCQKQNYIWDINLRKRFRNFCYILGAILSLPIIFIYGDTGLIIILPIIKYLYTLKETLSENINNIKEIDNLIYSTTPKNMDTLQNIQSKIFSYRKSAFCIPNKFYMLFKNNDEDTAHRMAQLDKDDFYLKK